MIVSNKLNSVVVIHLVANDEFVVAGNNSISNLAVGEEILTHVSVNKVLWGTDGEANSYWEISKEGNTFLVLTKAGELNLSGHGMALPVVTANGDANLEFNYNGGAGFILIELRKHGKVVDLQKYEPDPEE